MGHNPVIEGECGGIEWCVAHHGVAMEGCDTHDRCDMADDPDGPEDCDLRVAHYAVAEEISRQLHGRAVNLNRFTYPSGGGG